MDYTKLFDLENKVVVIVGGLGLIGKEIAKGALAAGAKTIICDINVEYGEKFVKEFNHPNLSFHRIDITSEQSIRDVIHQINNDFNKIDAWVNVAYPRTKDWGNKLEEVTKESWDSNITLHLTGYFLCSKLIIQYFYTQGSGSLINFSSIYGVVGPDFSIYDDTEMTMPVAYSAIKGGINTLTKYLANYYPGSNIRVNVICPGGVFDKQDDQFVKRYSKKVPLRRMADPSEIVGPAIFLISDASSYVNGEILMVDGGLTSN